MFWGTSNYSFFLRLIFSKSRSPLKLFSKMGTNIGEITNQLRYKASICDTTDILLLLSNEISIVSYNKTLRYWVIKDTVTNA